jgi:hypothetical protein
MRTYLDIGMEGGKALKSETGKSPTDAEARRSVNEWKNEVKHMNDGARKVWSTFHDAQNRRPDVCSGSCVTSAL